ncbi:hypothetical protein G7046_g8463 [Stylonectria norvegica]|nr:hypothetical protein G7046_g8463 [Stylonectria norvegica]
MSFVDKYDTLEKIGHGSFGVIRKVRRKTDGFIMCRKEISYLRMSQKEREQLHAEFQILSHLRHDNIVAYYHREHLKASQDLHLYMEYCGNGDLGRVISDLAQKGQRAQESFVWSIFSQLVMALYRCHYGSDPPEAGANVLGLTQGTVPGAPKVPTGTMTILHRDLKPENVFLGEDNSVKLGDFGLSKMIQSHDFASTYVGTPFYMSPEICAAEKYTLKSDIWSLGCIIYELCAREPPFNAKSHFQLVQKIKEGRYPPLPEVYSPNLCKVIQDCLKVNPDRRPSTAELLNLPIVKLMRKEKEVADLNKSLRAREEALHKRERELNEGLEAERTLIREELDSSLRREWELKAHLEIDRLVHVEMDRLQGRFEHEVQARVEAELAKRGPHSMKPADEYLHDKYASLSKNVDYRPSSPSRSRDEPPLATDITEVFVDSPESPKEIKRTARTPFGRAQTMFAQGAAGTPMDIEMVSPSPMAIASLSLSPRRNGATKAPTATTGNIFAANAHGGADKSSWELPHDLSLGDSDSDDVCLSPTRQIKSSKNPFTSKTRPVLTSQKSCPVNRLRPQSSNNGLVSKAASQPDLGPRSPNRRLSKIPSAANLQSDAMAALPPTSGGGLVRKPSLNIKDSEDVFASKAGLKSKKKNNIQGRTLVELQQARAGGRPLSEVVLPSATSGESVSPMRAFRDRLGCERRSSGDEPAAVWDPERDEMPSPFLVRQRRFARV